MNLRKIFTFGFIYYIDIYYCSVQQNQPPISQKDSAINDIIVINEKIGERIPYIQSFILNTFETGGFIYAREFAILELLGSVTPDLDIKSIFEELDKEMQYSGINISNSASNITSIQDLYKRLNDKFENIKKWSEQLKNIKNTDVLDKSTLISITSIIKEVFNDTDIEIAPPNALYVFEELMLPLFQNLDNFTDADFDKIKDSTFILIDQLIVLFQTIYSYKDKNELFFYSNKKIELVSNELR